MAIVEMQAWSSFVDNSAAAVIARQENWGCSNEARTYDTDGPFGQGAIAADRNTWWVQFDGGLGLTTAYVAFWCYPSYLGLGDRTFSLFSEGTIASPTHHLDFTWDGSGLIKVKRGSGGTEVARSAAGVLRSFKWHHVMMKMVIDDSAGVVVVNVNNEEVINETGLDTQNGGTGLIDTFQWTCEYQYSMRLAEPIIWSGAGDSPTAFFGFHRVHMIKPDGETSVAFTPLGAGTNDVEVDEQAHDDDTSYNESSTVTNKDKLTTESLPTGVATVYAVQAQVLAKDPDGTATESVKVGLDSGTESLSGAKALSTGYEIWEGPIETVDPNTSSQWTESNVNATDVVYEHA